MLCYIFPGACKPFGAGTDPGQWDLVWPLDGTITDVLKIMIVLNRNESQAKHPLVGIPGSYRIKDTFFISEVPVKLTQQ